MAELVDRGPVLRPQLRPTAKIKSGLARHRAHASPITTNLASDGQKGGLAAAGRGIAYGFMGLKIGVAARSVIGFQEWGSAPRRPNGRLCRLLCRGHRPTAGQCPPRPA